MNTTFDWIKEHAIGLIVTLAMIAAIVGIAFAAYAHRVVEFKDYPASAVVTGTHHEPGHYETVSRVNSRGDTYLENVWRNPVYGLKYEVTYEDTTYPFYQTVSEDTFYACRTGDTVPATFRKEWRADGSETYRIYVKGNHKAAVCHCCKHGVGGGW